MSMAYLNATHDILLKALKKFPEIDLKTRRRLAREFDLQMLDNDGLIRFDIGEAMFFFLAFISDGDLDGKIKKPIAKRVLLQPDYDLDIKKLTNEQISTILWTAVAFMRRMGRDTYEDFKKTLGEWDNSKLGENNPFIPF